MQYRGGKAKIAKNIVKAINADQDLRGRMIVEPFVGAMNLAEQWLRFGASKLRASDMSEDIAALWRAGVAGWDPPNEVTETEYKIAKGEPPSPRRTFISYACSFAGKEWGGYARGRWVSCEREARRFREKAHAARELRAEIHAGDYREFSVPPMAIVYADPPYVGAEGYGKRPFDSDAFWTWAAVVSAYAHVYVSEYVAPAGWISILCDTRRDGIGAGVNKLSRARPIHLFKRDRS